MNRHVVAAVIILAFAPMGALAQSRGGDAALGAVSGAVVLGPVGAVAGALVGYTAGPAIAHSWGLRGSHSRNKQGRIRTPAASARVVQSEPAPSGSAGPPAQAQAAVQAQGVPPVQGFE
jgi:hypothetical protein